MGFIPKKLIKYEKYHFSFIRSILLLTLNVNAQYTVNTDNDTTNGNKVLANGLDFIFNFHSHSNDPLENWKFNCEEIFDSTFIFANNWYPSIEFNNGAVVATRDMSSGLSPILRLLDKNCNPIYLNYNYTDSSMIVAKVRANKPGVTFGLSTVGVREGKKVRAYNGGEEITTGWKIIRYTGMSYGTAGVDSLCGFYFSSYGNDLSNFEHQIELEYVYFGKINGLDIPEVQELYCGVFIDENKNGIKDKDEYLIGRGDFRSNLVRTLRMHQNRITPFLLDTGQQTISYFKPQGFNLTTDSVFNVHVKNGIKDTIWVGVSKSNIYESSVEEYLSMCGPPKCSQIKYYGVNLVNNTFSPIKVVYGLCLDDVLVKVNPGSLDADSVVGNCYYYTSKLIDPFDHVVYFHPIMMPDWTETGKEIVIATKARVIEPESFKCIAHSSKDIFRCAVTSNEKSVDIETIEEGYSDQFVEYKIQFQNNGNYPASRVIIRDTLSSKLDWSTLKVFATSHPTEINIDNDGALEFAMINIQLPESSSDEPGSHGFVRYRVKVKDGYSAGEVIENKAHVYFDYNPAVATNTAETNIIMASSVESTEAISNVVLRPNPTSGILEIVNVPSVNQIQVFGMDGQQVFEANNQTTFNFENFSAGVYFVQVTIGQEVSVIKMIKL